VDKSFRVNPSPSLDHAANLIYNYAMDIKEKIEKLTEELLKHQYLYYVNAAPEVSDLEYDRLFDELVELEKKYPEYASENSPTKRVGSDLDNSFPEKAHSIPVLSLDKEYSIGGLEKWLNKTISNADKTLSFVVEEKIDGASIVLYYKAGKLDTALTRGNGVVGNDVTENVRTIKQIPLVTGEMSDFAVRGEIFFISRNLLLITPPLKTNLPTPATWPPVPYETSNPPSWPKSP
jgi:DNA ligase (NAD+)